MDKNAIKKFAVWARRELISRVSQRAAWYGITEKDPIDEKLQAIHGHVLTPEEQAQRRALIWHIRKNGYQQVMEEAAYTWFNRFIALRFMEVNGYLPSYTRVFSDENGAFNPQILKDAIHLDIEGLDMEKVYAMEEANETEALFKYLVITQCNDLNRMLPGMFQKISDYTELLFPDFLLREGSVAHQMVTTIPEEDWKDAVQIIGWLYQYYNAEPKDEVFAALKKNIKISKEKIPAATQLFTPDWIVRYMVENSLGRLWVEGHPNDELKANWKYYLEEASQEPEVEKQLKKIRAEYAQIDPASILCCDPCMGSGHILVYMFDVLMQIYLAYGYTTNEAVESIVRNNLWGMDIDDRAAQLAYFAVMMKAQQYDHRWLSKQLRHPVQPNVFALQDSGDWLTFERQMRQAFTHHPSLAEDASIRTAKALFETFADAKEYGSIIQPDISLEELYMLENVLDEMAQKADLMDIVAQADAMALMETLKPLIRECKALVQKYDTVVTNPPYMSSGGMNAKLTRYIKNNYSDEKADIFAAFIERCFSFVKAERYVAMITMESWMFLPVFEDSRKRWLHSNTISSLIHMPYLGKGGTSLGIAFGNAAFVFWKAMESRYAGHYECIRYYETDEEGVPFSFPLVNERYGFKKQSDFMAIKSAPVSYWASDSVFANFRNNMTLENYIDARSGISTGDNNRFYRCWFECNNHSIAFDPSKTPANSEYRWFPIIRGGDFRKWYGNMENVLNLFHEGYDIRTSGNNFRLRTPAFYNRKGITWNRISSRDVSFRVKTEQVNFGENSPCMFVDEENYLSYIGFLNSVVAKAMLEFVNSTMTFQVIDIQSIPYKPIVSEELNQLVEECIELSKSDWDDYERSWDFVKHPFMCGVDFIGDAFAIWEKKCKNRFRKLKQNEEKINQIFIAHYGVGDILTPEISDEDVTVRLADANRDVRSFISYAVGCMFGRYSLDTPGLAYAGGEWNHALYSAFKADKDAIIPISDDEYFEDDIVNRFISFLKCAFGPNRLDDNLKFIAATLGGKGSPVEVIRNYFLNSFYSDHCASYFVTSVGKRPIYWLFDSGNKNGFKCLIYMHRYRPDTIARIRTDYLHETQARYRNAIETLERQSANASTGERVKMTKRLNALKAQAEEARVYEEKIHHLADQMIKIDLDDGVKVNYAKFADVLAPIK